MHTRLSSKGQVVLPGPVRRKLGLNPGDELEIRIDDGRIVLTPPAKQLGKPRIVTDAVTGVPVLTSGTGARLTSEDVAGILSDFP